jgi:hypothetical protein
MRDYIRDNFYSDDWLAVVCKRDRVQQRIVTAEELASLQFQSLLKIENRRGANIYVSMNALRPEAPRRTKQDIAAIRHIYLDIDHNGRDALAKITADAPCPSYILTTSPGKYQVVWKADGFSPKEAEALQKAMAIRYGADRAATDVTRVLRVPGFTNQKYAEPYLVTAEKISNRIYCPADFRIDRLYEAAAVVERNSIRNTPRILGGNSQSERDWFEACRRIECGDEQNDVQKWLEETRQDKPNPKYYAGLTVSRAVAHCAGKNKPFSIQEIIMENANRGNAEEYIIGHVRAGIGKQLGKEGLGLQWNEKIGWRTKDPEKAKAAHAKILETNPRYYLEGNTYAVRDIIKAWNKKTDSPEGKIFYDPYNKKQYAVNPEVREAVQAKIPQNREKLYLEGDDRAIYAIREQLKAITMPGSGGKELKTFSYDKQNEKWYTYELEALKRAQAALDAEMKKPRYREPQTVKDHNPANNGEKHFIPNVPFELNKAMRELGCKWDPDAKSWYHTDSEKAKEAERLLQEHSKQHGASVAQAVVKEVAHEM